MLCQLSYAVKSVRVDDISELSLVPDIWDTSPMLCQLSYVVKSVRVDDISELSLVPDIEGTRLSSEISLTRTDLTT